jgi:hypothetical protein
MREGVTQRGRAGRTAAPSLEGVRPPLPKGTPDDKRQTITESRPYDRDAVIEAEIREMEDLGEEMRREIMKSKGDKR